jgi:ribosomal protein L15E
MNSDLEKEIDSISIEIVVAARELVMAKQKENELITKAKQNVVFWERRLERLTEQLNSAVENDKPMSELDN